MAKPFDATTKYLVEASPAAWLRYLGLAAAARAEVISAELSTITAEADQVVRVEEAEPWLVHIEFQGSADRTLPERMLRYNVLLHGRHGVPTRSVVVLLRAEADRPVLSGTLELALPKERPYLRFEYGVVRAWEQPLDVLLTGDLATLPMAPLAAEAPQRLPEIVRRIDERLSDEATPAQAGVLWTATYVLMGLRYPQSLTRQVLQGVRAMRESVTYQAIVEEGRVEEGQRIILRQGRLRFGPPDARTTAAVESIADVDRLEALSERLLEVGSWEELLASA